MNEFAETQAILNDQCRQFEFRLSQLRNARNLIAAAKYYSADTMFQALSLAYQIEECKREWEECKNKKTSTET